jgi:hypothetical protein
MTDKKAKVAAPEKKIKMMRDSFTMPKQEYAAIDTLKARALGMQLAAKKSELLRAGLLALSAMDDASLKMMLSAVPTLKTGRPKKAAPPAAAQAVTAAAAKAPAAVPARTPAKAPVRARRAATNAPAPVAPKAPAKAARTTAVRPAPAKRAPARKVAAA